MSSSQRDWLVFIDDMLHSLERIASICRRHTLESFVKDEDASDLVAYHFQILGEASRRLPEPIVKNHLEIPWREIQDTRNRLIHGYFTINRRTLWLSAQNDLHKVQDQLVQLRSEAKSP